MNGRTSSSVHTSQVIFLRGALLLVLRGAYGCGRWYMIAPLRFLCEKITSSVRQRHGIRESLSVQECYGSDISLQKGFCKRHRPTIRYALRRPAYV